MRIPLKYNVRNLWTRRLTTTLTVTGIVLVSFVFASVLMLANGLEKTLVATGYDENAIIVRKSANTEIVSIVPRDIANIVKSFPEVALSNEGKALVSSEVVVIINLLKVGSNAMGNVTVRGVSPEAFELRPAVKLTRGRTFSVGSSEIVVGRSIAELFQGCRLGQQLRFGDRTWTIVGILEAKRTAFESEIWGDAEQLMPAFGRPVFSSVTLRLRDPQTFDAVAARVEADPRTNQMEVKRERVYYAQQSEFMATFIRILGLVITITFSIGAMIGAMITMYSAVANRTREVGTLRALGFRRRSILFAFLLESLVISVAGGTLGLFAASFMQFFRVSTINFDTFSELSFGFSLTPSTVFLTLLFALLMGLVGGFLPAVRAARCGIVDALRSA